MRKTVFFLFAFLCSAFFFPNNSFAKGNNTVELFIWKDSPDGARELIYNYPKPAVIYSLNFNKGDKITPGANFITLHIEGRSKAEVKTGAAMEILETGLLKGAPICPSETIERGQLILRAKSLDVYHESMDESKTSKSAASFPSWGNMLVKLWQTTGIYDLYRQSAENFTETWNLGIGKLLMIAIGLILLYLAIFKNFEPLLLLPIGFGAIMANIPLAGIAGPDGLLGMVYAVGIKTGVFPLLIFLGVGAMTDFGPLIANPITALLGAAAQFGIFFALLGSLLLGHVGINFDLCDAASIGIIGGADGPTAIFLTSKLSPELLGAIAVAAYSYMALVPIIQPPIMKLLTTAADRKIKMRQLRHVSKIEKICFPVVITLLCALLLPSAAPLISMLMLGNLMRECGVVDRLSNTAQNALINTVTIFLGLSVGSKLSAENFLNIQTLGILLLGMIAFCVGTAAGVLFGQIMKILSGGKINPLIGAAGVSAVPMSARVVNKLGLEADPHNFLLMHAMGPNVSGVIGSAVAAGVMLSFLS